MTLRERVERFNATYAKWPAAHLTVSQEQGRDVCYGIWVIGNDYRNKSSYYGAYPRGYLERISALFPDVGGPRLLHAFSGGLAAGDYVRCDSHQPSELHCSVYELPKLVSEPRFSLVMADPPYSLYDAKRYGTSSVDRGLATYCLAQITQIGGYLVWLDTTWPMHSKTEWVTVGRIPVIRSTNHRVRLCSIFERVEHG
jgi:hypothetical protein